MNRILKVFFLVSLFLGFAMQVYAQNQTMMSPRGSCIRGTIISQRIAELPRQEISPTEKAGLIKMREEEKLARDVYSYLGKLWGLPIFNNITRAEQQHMEMVKALLDKYHISDPVVDDTPGVFSDPQMKSLYETLISKGKKSIIDALQVGMIIEDLDIKDLKDELAKTDNQDIKLVYQNLIKGSRNHMRAFMRQLKMRGGSYKPKYLSQEEVNQILSSSFERGPVDAEGKPLSLKGRRFSN